jgi:mannose-6-phosphate isomerase-like protein (cupin superfamily)
MSWIEYMAILPRRPKFTLLALSMLAAPLGCTPALSPYVFLQYGKELRSIDLAKVLAENPLGANENFKLTTLGQSQSASHHVVQIRERESPHMHKAHDATVIIIRGRGYLVMDTRRINLTASDITHIPRGVPHYYVNTDLEPTVAFVVFAPPFDGKDSVPVKMP